MKQQLTGRDLFWILGFPFYLIFGTFIHEFSHAISAVLEGAVITKFVFWPTRNEGKLLWGYVRWEGDVSWFATAAPYLGNLVTFIIFFIICTRVHFKHH